MIESRIFGKGMIQVNNHLGDIASMMKFIGCFIAIIVLVIVPVSAYPYCGSIQAGSSFDLTSGSITTNANDMFINTNAGIPTGLNYEIQIKPYSTKQGQIPAMGSASAYYRVHTLEGRTGSSTVSQEFISSEETSVSGIISGFSKIIKWQSGMNSLV